MVCYLILAATNQKNVVQLIDDLRCEGVRFLIHVDAKFTISSELLRLATSDHVELINDHMRINCNWSGRTLVEAMLVLLSVANTTFKDSKTFQFLSDSCSTLKKAEQCRNELLKRGTKIHFWGKLAKTKDIHLNRRFVDDIWLFDYRCLNYRNYKNKYAANIINYFTICIRLFLKSIIRINRERTYYKGSQWFSITRDDYISYIKDYDSLLESLKFSKAPDEIFFHTLLSSYLVDEHLNSEYDFANHYIDWSDPKVGPKQLQRDEIILLMENSQNLFCRKVK